MSESEDLNESMDNRVWNRADELALVELIRAHPVLWHRSDPYFFAKGDKKERARRAIGRQLRRSELEIKRKVKGLISGFMADRKKTFPSFKYFDRMRFIDEGKNGEPNNSSGSDAASTTSAGSRSEELSEMDCDTRRHRPNAFINGREELVGELMQAKRELFSPSPPLIPLFPSPVSLPSPPPTSSDTHSPSSTETVARKEDEAAIFGDLVASRLRSLGPAQIAHAQIAILQCLSGLAS